MASTPESVSASTSARPAPIENEVLKEIHALFDWSPDLLKQSQQKMQSTKTRPPPFFDKHFKDVHILKRVQRLPSLVDDLAKNVDKALNVALATLPPLDSDGSCFIAATERYKSAKRISLEAQDEKAVASYYEKTTAQYCLPLASTLALHPNAPLSEWRPLLEWTQSVSSSGYAIMDGQLSIIRNYNVEEEGLAIEDRVKWDRGIFQELKKSKSPFVTWEMKSLSAGPVEVITSVLALEEFEWKKCTECRPNASLGKHRKPKDDVEKLKIGPDALIYPWRLPVRSYSLIH